MSGERRVGPYALLAERERDELGTLWEARDERTGAAVEVRLLPAGLARNNLVHARFLGDAARAAAVEHPSVVRVLEGGEAAGELFLASAPPRGRSLASLLEEARGTAPPEGAAPIPGEGKDGFARAAAFFERLARALQAIHDRGLVHGRLDPRRVLVLPDGTPEVRDLGLPGSGLLGELPLGKAPERATPWSSPESLDPTELLEPRADVYSLGALLYQVLSLRPPHEEATTEGLAWRLRSHDPTPLRRWNPAVPKALALVVTNAMARDRGPRYRSAADLAADLRRFLEGKPVGLRREPLPARLVRWPVRHPVLVFNLLLLCMAVEAVVLLWGASLPMDRLRRENVELRERNALHARRLDSLAQSEGWIQALRALEPLLEASRDCGDSDPDLAVLLARTALERARSREWATLPDAARFRLRAVDRIREILHRDREISRTRPTGFPALHYAKSGVGIGVVAAGSPDGTVRFLDGAGRLLSVGNSHTGAVRGVRTSGDGSLFLTGSEDGTARLWGDGGREVAVYAGHRSPVNAAATHDGRLLLTGSDDGTAILWHGNGQRRAVLEGHRGPVLDVAVDGEQSLLLTASADGTARAWNAEGVEVRVLSGHDGEVRRILPWRSGGSAWLTLSADGTVRTWTAGGEERLVLRHGGAPTSVADGGDGRILTGAEDGVLRLFDGEGALVASITVPGTRIHGVDRDPGSGLLLAACGDGAVRLFTERGAEVDAFTVSGGGAALGGSFAPGGEFVHGAFEDGSLATWTREGTELGVWREAPGEMALAFLRPPSPWGRGGFPGRTNVADLAVLSGAREGRGRTLALLRPGERPRWWPLRDAPTGLLDAASRTRRSLTGGDDGILRLRSFGSNEGEEFGDAGPAATAVFLGADDSVVGGYADGAVRHWDSDGTLHAGEATAGPPHAAPVLAVAWDEVAGILASGSADGSVALHRKGSDQRIALGRPVAGLAWSQSRGPGPDRVLAVVGRDGTWGVLDPRGRLLQKNWKRLPEGGVIAVAAADDGSFLVLTDSGGGACRAWRLPRDMGDPDRLAVLEGNGAVAAAALDGGGGSGRWRAATASADGTVRLFALDEEGLLDVSRLRVPRSFTEEEKDRLSRLALRPPPPARKRP